MAFLQLIESKLLSSQAMFARFLFTNIYSYGNPVYYHYPTFWAAYCVGIKGTPECLIVLGGFTFVGLAFSVSIPVKL
jgi:hypothetical protein